MFNDLIENDKKSNCKNSPDDKQDSREIDQFTKNTKYHQIVARFEYV